MKGIFLLPFFLLPPMLFSQPAPSLEVMSFNLRLNTERDGDNAWPYRLKMVQSMVRFHQVDLLGVQEALDDQMEDLRQMLPDFAHHGIPRDSGDWAEYSAIWYRKSRLEWLEGSTFWLSETPEAPSRGWDAALNRIVSWARFRDRQTDKEFLHFNTHFDHRGKTAREESAKLLLAEIQRLNPNDLPVIVTGDFNSAPASTPYQILTQSPDLPPLQDAWSVSQMEGHGPNSSWSGFEIAGMDGRRIDYVFVQGNILVLRCGSLSDSWAGRFPSDHLPVLAEVILDPVKPLPRAHAHNDYEHTVPLFDALNHGFTSIEVDVWLIKGELYVSHNKPQLLRPAETLRAMYLDPLAKRVSEGHGQVFPGSAASLYLMIDLKNNGEEAYGLLDQQLRSYRWILLGNAGNPPPVKIFLSGDRPIDMVLNNPLSLVSLDGRPEDLGKGIPAKDMPVVSQRYNKILDWYGAGEIPPKGYAKLKDLLRQAHSEGKRVRLWGSPENEVVWKALLNAGVDIINTDELTRLQVFLQEN